MGTIAIRLTYAIMIVGIIFCYLFTRNHQHDIRDSVNEFAEAFVRLSNFLMKTPPKKSLAVERADNKVKVRPVDEQPDQIKAIIRRVSSPKVMEMFTQLDEAAEKVAKRAGFNRTYKSQFQKPIDELLILTQEFLEDCKELSRIDSEDKLKRFESYIYEQPELRMVLLKRISGAYGDEYRELNLEYASEMEEIEAKEAEQKRTGSKAAKDNTEINPEKRTDKAEKDSDKRTKKSEKYSDMQSENSEAKQDSQNNKEDLNDNAEQHKEQEEESLRDKWGGYGCG